MFFILILFSPSFVSADSWWNEDWPHRIELNLTEIIGISRTDYAVIKNVTFSKGISNCPKEIRVVQCINEKSSNCFGQKEIPFNILSGDNSSWCEIEFPINLSANSWRNYYIYYGNKGVERPDYGNYKMRYFVLFDKKMPYGNGTAAVGFWIVNDTDMHMILTDISANNEETRMWKFNVTNKNWEEVPVDYSGRSGGMNVVTCLPSGKKCYALGEHTRAGPESRFVWTGKKWKYLGTINVDGVFTAATYSKNYSESGNNFTVVGAGWNKIIHITGNRWSIKKSNLIWHTLGAVVIRDNLAYISGSPHGIAKWDGIKWNAINVDKRSNGIDCWSENDCWAVGNNGYVLVLNGTSWRNYTTKITENLNEVFMTGFDRGYIIGDNGIILRLLNGNLYKTLNITTENLGRKAWRYGGPSIFMKNDSYGWVGGGKGVILHRGSVSVEVVGEEKGVNKSLDVLIKPTKSGANGEGEFYLENEDPGFDVAVLRDGKGVRNLKKENFNVTVNCSIGKIVWDEVELERVGDRYKIGLRDFFDNTEELGKFELEVDVKMNDSKGENKTSFYFLKIPRKGWIEVDNDWREILGASATGWPVKLGDERKLIDCGEEYKVNNLLALEKMFLDDRNKILVDKNNGVFGPRLAKEMNRILVFDENDCEENCLNLKNISEEEIDDLYLERLGGSDYFILVNKNRENFLLAAEMSVYRRGVPILVDVAEVGYPESINTFEDLGVYNRNNKVGEIKEKISEKIGKFFESKNKDYIQGNAPKILIIGSGRDIPYFLVEDLGLEDIVREPSGNELWLKTDSYYGDLNDDGFQDIVVGRINKGLEKGLKEIFKIIEIEGERPKIGIGAEYNHIKGIDLLTAGGSMLNGFIAESGVKKYDTRRIVERRLENESMKDELYEELKKIILKSIDKNFGIYYYKISMSEKLLYNLLERDWMNWNIGSVPGILDEIDKERMGDIFDETNVSMFFGSGDKNKIYFPDDEELDLREVDGGFLVLDYSYSGYSDVDGAGFIGNTGLLHDVASREFWSYFFGKIERGIGYSFMRAKNNLVKGFVPGEKNLPKKEYYEKILLTDPGIKIFKRSFTSNGFHSAERHGEYFKDTTTIRPEYEKKEGRIVFYNYSMISLVPNKPMVPVYTGSIIIPSGAEIKDIKVEKFGEIIDGSIPIFRDEYYEEKDFDGIYPQDEWWKNEKEYLDGRKEIIFSVPVRYRDGKIILNRFNFTVIYSSGLEVIGVDVVGVEDKEVFDIEIESEKDRKAKIFLDIFGNENTEISRNVELKKGNNEIKIKWNGSPGEYKAQVVVVSDVTIGPRELDFVVERKPDFLSITTDAIIKVWKNLGGEIERLFKNNKIELRKVTPKAKIESWVEDGKKITRMTGRDFVLSIEEGGELRRVEFKSPTGKIVIKKWRGNKEERIYRNGDVKNEFEEAKRKLKDELQGMK